MIPGEYFLEDGDIPLNAGRRTVTLVVANAGDRPVQVGSHYHFFEANEALHERRHPRIVRLENHLQSAFVTRSDPTNQLGVTCRHRCCFVH